MESIANNISISQILIRSYRLTNKRTKRLILLSTSIFSFLRIFDVISLGLVFPIIGLLSGAGEKIDQITHGKLNFLFEGRSDLENALVVSGIFVLMIIIKSALSITATYWFNKFFLTEMAYLASRLYNKYLNAPIEFHMQINVAELQRNLITSITTWYGNIVRPSGNLIADVLLTIMIAFLVVYANPFAAIVAVAILILGACAYWRAASKPLMSIGHEMHKVNRDHNQNVLEGLSAVQDITVLGKQNYFHKRFVKTALRTARASNIYDVIQQVPQHILEIIVALALFGFIVLAKFGYFGDDIVAFTIFLGAAMVRLVPSIQRVVLLLNQIRVAAPSLLQLESDVLLFGDKFILEPSNTQKTSPPRENSLSKINLSTGDIRFKNVNYSFNQKKMVVFNLSLTIPVGSTIGIIGSSGAGKSTFAKLLLGLLKPDSGEILFNGISLKSNDIAIEKLVGYVPQDISLLDDTVRRNIAFGLNDDEIDDTKLSSAIKKAQLTEMIDSMELGLDTVIGEKGTRLSGGQRQRIAIGRALYNDPKIIIFDEATSSLDVVTESNITDTLESLRSEKTIVIIAHRINTVQKCEKLFFLKNGSCTAEGSFEELNAEYPEFAEWVKKAQIEDQRSSSPIELGEN